MDEKLIKQISNFFRTKPVMRAYVFGSESRNESKERSDVDILVELDYSKPIGLQFVKMRLELEDIIHKKVDLLSSKAISKYIRPFIDRDKILIYEK